MLAANRIGKIPILSLNRSNIQSIFNNNMNNINDNDLITDVIKSNNCELIDSILEYTPNDIQTIIFTSGNTGNPKPVELTFNNILSSAKNWNKEIEFHESDIYLNMLPVDHIGGLSIFFRALYYNFSMLINSFSIQNLYKALNQEKITLISMVPTTLYMALEDEMLVDSMNKIRYVILGGALMDFDLISKAFDLKISLYLSYGMTETCSGIAGVKITKDNVNSYSYKAFNDVDIIVDNSKIIIKSPTLMYGYFGDVREKREYFITHDLGSINNNQLSIQGRSDDIIISGGENFSSRYIENEICKLKGVNSCRVVGEYNPKWGQKIVAYIEIDSDFKHVNSEYLFKMMKSNMNKKIIPKFFYIIDNMQEYSW